MGFFLLDVMHVLHYHLPHWLHEVRGLAPRVILVTVKSGEVYTAALERVHSYKLKLGVKSPVLSPIGHSHKLLRQQAVNPETRVAGELRKITKSHAPP